VTESVGQGDQKIGKKFTQILEKVAKTVAKQTNAEMSTSKLNLEVQNIYIKPLSNPLITRNKSCFEAAY
jgi:hypothetical protein